MSANPVMLFAILLLSGIAFGSKPCTPITKEVIGNPEQTFSHALPDYYHTCTEWVSVLKKDQHGNDIDYCGVQHIETWVTDPIANKPYEVKTTQVYLEWQKVQMTPVIELNHGLGPYIKSDRGLDEHLSGHVRGCFDFEILKPPTDWLVKLALDVHIRVKYSPA